MGTRADTYPPDAILDRGKNIYDRLIKPTLEMNNVGRLVAIDVDSEAFEIGDSSVEATQRLLVRQPEAWVAVMRIGGGPVHRIAYSPCT